MTVEETIGELKEHGYWEIVLKPEPHQYVKEKFSFDDLQNLVVTNQVKRRGIPFPYLSRRSPSNYYVKDDFVESFTRLGGHLTAFRFYRSGQFVHYVNMVEDTLGAGGSMFELHDPHRGRSYLSPSACLYQLTEIFLFASRLATKGVFGDRTIIQIDLHNLNGRVLRHNDNKHFPFHNEYLCHTNKIPIRLEKTPPELQAEHDDLAVKACTRILEQFGFSKYDHNALKSDQRDFYGRVS